MNIYDEHSPEQDWQREQFAESMRREADERWEYQSHVERLACPMCQSENLHITTCEDPDYDVAVCLECRHQGDIAGDFLVKPALPRIEAKPVKFAETMQGNLFDGEVA